MRRILFLTALLLGSIASADNGFSEPLKSTKSIELTLEEQQFLTENPVLTASNELKWAPFNFVENGMPRGFSIDYLNLLAKKAGFQISYINGPSWDDFVEMSKKRELDILLNVAFSEERTDWLEYTKEAYFQVHYGLAVDSSETDIHQFNDILDKSIAVENGFWMHNWLQQN